MNTREKRLVLVLGVMGAFGLVIGLYMFVAAPYQEAVDAARTLEKDYGEKSDTLTAFEKKAKKLKSAMQRSLPGDADVARREYESMLGSLIRASGVPAGYTVIAKNSNDASRVPQLSPKQPAYTQIGYDITLRKVDLPTIVKFLEAYYHQPVLQQITKFTIKRSAAESDSGAKKSDSRADLEAIITTEGVVVDGAEKRQTLYPISTACGAIGGGLGYGLLQNSPQIARNFKVAVYDSVLAANRDYSLLKAKDLFHGPLPTPPQEYIDGPKSKDPIETPPPVPKEDISPYIRLTGITWRSDGSVVAEIVDMANKHEYEVSRVFGLDGSLGLSVKKYFYIGSARKPLESLDDLTIAEDGTATDRRFKVLAFQGDGLLLSEMPLAKEEKDEPAADESKSKTSPIKTGSKTGSGRTGGKSSGTKKTSVATAGGALAGPLAFIPVKRVEKRYLWPIGSSLKDLKELPMPGTVKVLEAAPMPREARIEK